MVGKSVLRGCYLGCYMDIWGKSSLEMFNLRLLGRSIQSVLEERGDSCGWRRVIVMENGRRWQECRFCGYYEDSDFYFK